MAADWRYRGLQLVHRLRLSIKGSIDRTARHTSIPAHPVGDRLPIAAVARPVSLFPVFRQDRQCREIEIGNRFQETKPADFG
jgi:hypothetical protein